VYPVTVRGGEEYCGDENTLAGDYSIDTPHSDLETIGRWPQRILMAGVACQKRGSNCWHPPSETLPEKVGQAAKLQVHRLRGEKGTRVTGGHPPNTLPT
jgi:hypothetical protein